MYFSGSLQHIKNEVSSYSLTSIALIYYDIANKRGFALNVVIEVSKPYDSFIFNNHR